MIRNARVAAILKMALEMVFARTQAASVAHVHLIVHAVRAVATPIPNAVTRMQSAPTVASALIIPIALQIVAFSVRAVMFLYVIPTIVTLSRIRMIALAFLIAIVNQNVAREATAPTSLSAVTGAAFVMACQFRMVVLVVTIAFVNRDVVRGGNAPMSHSALPSIIAVIRRIQAGVSALITLSAIQDYALNQFALRITGKGSNIEEGGVRECAAFLMLESLYA